MNILNDVFGSQMSYGQISCYRLGLNCKNSELWFYTKNLLKSYVVVLKSYVDLKILKALQRANNRFCVQVYSIITPQYTFFVIAA